MRSSLFPNTSTYAVAAAIVTLAVICAASVRAQNVGQTSRVQFGVVRSAQEVPLNSNAAQGAIVGGMLGIASGGGGRSSRRVRNGMIGAGAGAALTGATEGPRMGMSYTVEMPDGSTTKIISDQREIVKGDCVSVEQVGETANIRRTSSSYCDAANQHAISSLNSHYTSEAADCYAAKQEVSAAETPDSIDAAIRKARLLCNG
jgi:hypothetical protein